MLIPRDQDTRMTERTSEYSQITSKKAKLPQGGGGIDVTILFLMKLILLFFFDIENAPKIPESVTCFENLTQKSGSYRRKTDPKSRHFPAPLHKGVPPPRLLSRI